MKLNRQREMQKDYGEVDSMDNCPICSWNFSKGDFKFLKYPTIFKNTEEKRPETIRFCSRCGLGIAFPPISEEMISELYTGGSYWQGITLSTSLRTFPVPFGLAKARWKIIEQYLLKLDKTKAIKILDVGAGHGCIGLVASNNRYFSLIKYTAVEPDFMMRQHLGKVWERWDIKSDLETTDLISHVSDKYYDVVVLSHILEHVKYPRATLELALSFLTLDGVLFIDVPNQDYLFKKDVFPHNLFFSLSSLNHLLLAESIEIVSLDVWGRDMFKSPLSYKAPVGMKLICEMIKEYERILPDEFLVNFYNWYFGFSKRTPNGTWIRALCQKIKQKDIIVKLEGL